MNSEFEFSVTVEEPMTIGLAVVVGVDAGRVMISPLWVMAEPGKSVWEPITKPQAEFAVRL